MRLSSVGELADRLIAQAGDRRRFVAAIAGAPGSGKSTIAAELCVEIGARGVKCAVVPMDGFHYDDAVLAEKGLSSRKGAPETFDFAGLRTLLRRLREESGEVAIPLFDRSMELSRAAAAIVDGDTRIVLVEGNYLLLDEEPWRGLADMFDASCYLDVPRPELERRLLERWRKHGRAQDDARRWVATNDLPNADRVIAHSRLPDIIL
ncbi:nucleoside/nucleotide kinase family protein [Nitratireductor thuwali]|uniref:Pantothenate kinase n=1 Tax=Nitratireductor thuwali TaxID=2267699 RepID=A0ABY5MK13_9HYPH|nr:Pantothenate kinase [Nitratireductor thuwali]